MDLNAEKTCPVCGKKYTGYGNNAWPVYDGRCCDACNMNYVIPARICGIKNPEEWNEIPGSTKDE